LLGLLLIGLVLGDALLVLSLLLLKVGLATSGGC